jgi:hypothetical protein
MSSRRTAVVPIYCALLLVGGQWPMTSPAYAAAFTVNNISDTHDAKPGDGICAIPNSKNVCTLRAAIDEVNALGGKTTHTIKVPANTYLLFLGELTVKAEVDITGSGAAATIVDGQKAFRIFLIEKSALVRVSAMTLRNGNAGVTSFGGCIHNSGKLTLKESVVSNCVAGNDGGGIRNAAGGFLFVLRSTISNNKSGGAGEGAGRSGGGIKNSGLLIVDSSTISGNFAFEGGGLSNGNQGSPSGITFMFSTTVGQNSAAKSHGVGIAVISGQVRMLSSINSNASNDDCLGKVDSQGYNLESGNTCGLNAVGDKTFADPLLGPLQDNGGPTPTHALKSGSVAIDGATNDECPSVDQRGVKRPIDGNGDSKAICDIGAFEFESGKRD